MHIQSCHAWLMWTDMFVFIIDPSINKSTMIGLAVFVILYSLIRLMIELIQAMNSIFTSINCNEAYTRFDLILRSVRQMKYFWDLTNWVELVLFPLTIAFAVQLLLPMNKDLCTTGRNWQIGAIVIWLSWIELILVSTQFRFIGVYAIMLKRILMSLVKLIPLASLLIIGFGYAFHLILYQPQYKVRLLRCTLYCSLDMINLIIII